MVTEEDCSCTDTTDPSNVTSLHSDDVTSVVNFEANVASIEVIDKRNDAVKAYKEADCKCSYVLANTNYCVAAPTEDFPEVPSKPKQQDNSRSQLPTTMQLQPNCPCLCRSHKINGYVLPVKFKKEKSYLQQFYSRFSWRLPKKGNLGKANKMYEIKLKHTQCPNHIKAHSKGVHKHLDAPKQEHRALQPSVCFEVPEGISNEDNKHNARKSKTTKCQGKSKPKKEETTEKIEIYYFDRGNSAYYRTTDCHPVLITDKCAEKTDQAATRFWAEIFGTVHIGIAFVTAFILQFLRFVLYSLIRPLTVGILQLIADYFVKPLLSIAFNALIQPVLILLYNIAMSLKNLCEPIAQAIGLFLREIANLCAAIRIVEIKHVHTSATACT